MTTLDREGTEQGYAEELARLAAQGMLRDVDKRWAKPRYDLSGNDYMGLATEMTALQQEVFSAWGEIPSMTSSASRLLASRRDEYLALEDWLSTHYGKSALLFNSGYHANVGVIQALSGKDTLWLADKLIHASAIDGLRLAGADFIRWRHNDMAQLETLLNKHARSYKRMIILAESIYSMDGDASPIHELTGLRHRFPNTLLYIDEAHAIGAFGPKGLGLCEQENLLPEVDILMGTLGKAVASSGAFVVCNPTIRNYLANKARSLIFSTALPPICASWSLAMLEKLETMEERRRHLAQLSEHFRKGIEAITGTANPSVSAIVPFVTGDASKAVEMSNRLAKQGILAMPIRRPTVPPGGERIRFSLNASLSIQDADNILEIIYRIWKELK